MRLVIFDIDGTLVTGPSTEKRFFLHLLRTGNQGPRQVLGSVIFLLRWGWRFGRHSFKKNKAYLAWLRAGKIRRLAAHWAGSALETAWFERCLDRLREHQAQGDRVILLSGTPDFLAEAIAARLSVPHAIGSRCSEWNGRFRLQPPALHPFAQEKLSLVRDLCEQYGMELEQVVAYADSVHDLALLENVGTPVAVRPDRQLLTYARARGWEILGDRQSRAFGSSGIFSTR